MLRRFYKGDLPKSEADPIQAAVGTDVPNTGRQVAETPSRGTNGERPGPVTNGPGVTGSGLSESGIDFIALRVDLHRVLIDRINLSTIDQISRADLAETIRPMVKSYVREKS